MEFALSLSVQSKLLISAGVISSASAIWHLLCILGGPSWFAFARAPMQVVESAQQGTMLAPIRVFAPIPSKSVLDRALG